MPVQPTIPTILTQKDWDKNKGTIAKMAGETGVGAALKEVQTAYDAVDWMKFDAKMAVPGAKLAAKVDEGFKAARAEYAGKVEVLRKKLQAVSSLATKVEASFKKNKLIPAASTKHVAELGKQADTWMVELRDNSVYFTASWKTFEDLKVDLEKRRQMGLSSIRGYIHTISEDAKIVIKDPKVATYLGAGTKGFHQGIRGLSAALATQTDDDLKKFGATWKPMAQDGFTPKQDDQVIPKVKEVLTVLKRLDGLVKA